MVTECQGLTSEFVLNRWPPCHGPFHSTNTTSLLPSTQGILIGTMAEKLNRDGTDSDPSRVWVAPTATLGLI